MGSERVVAMTVMYKTLRTLIIILMFLVLHAALFFTFICVMLITAVFVPFARIVIKKMTLKERITVGEK